MPYNPNQPRDPLGSKTGGQWSSIGNSARVAAGLPLLDTFDRYNHGGRWTEERQRLHKQIIAEFFKGKTPVSNPQSFLFGGGGGSGKSTLKEELFRLGKLPENIVQADGDAIKFMLPEMKEAIAKKDLSGAALVHEESAWLSKEVAKKAAAGDYNLLMDGIGDNGLENLKAKVDLVDGDDHPLKAIYVTVDTKTAVQRAINRAARTGRMSSAEIVSSSHKAVSIVFPQAVAAGVFREFVLYDTNGQKPRIIAEGQRSKIVIKDPKAYKKFLDKSKE
jgi:hypothetical protein